MTFERRSDSLGYGPDTDGRCSLCRATPRENVIECIGCGSGWRRELHDARVELEETRERARDLTGRLDRERYARLRAEENLEAWSTMITADMMGPPYEPPPEGGNRQMDQADPVERRPLFDRRPLKRVLADGLIRLIDSVVGR